MIRIPAFINCVYAFWVGMPFDTQVKILDLCADSPAVRALTVFQDRKWRTPDLGILSCFRSVNQFVSLK